eukprot:6207900-Pleurochrysis_carterae.AAC.4
MQQGLADHHWASSCRALFGLERRRVRRFCVCRHAEGRPLPRRQEEEFRQAADDGAATDATQAVLALAVTRAGDQGGPLGLLAQAGPQGAHVRAPLLRALPLVSLLL